MHLKLILLTIALYCSKEQNLGFSKNIGIINGRTAKEKQFPHHAGILLHTNRGINFCGGSLIGDKWVLTTGQCSFGADIFYVYFGATNLNIVDPNRVLVTTNKYITHEAYNSTTLQNDIGLIELEKPIKFNDYIQPISLNTKRIGANITATISGWGRTGDSEPISDDLLYTSVTTMNNWDCAKVYKNISDKVLCTKGRTNQGFCQGDIGGALIIIEDEPIQIGIASHVSSNGCEYGDPSVYVRVSQYRDWIRQKTGI